MQPESGVSTSIWMATASVPDFPPLAEDTSADVCVVGAGLAGLTTSLLLLRQGRSVVVLDDGPVAGGETSRTTAHLASALDDRFTHLEKLYGEEGARLAGQSHAAAIDAIERIAQELEIDCDFRRLDGFLFCGPGQDRDQLMAELDAAQRAGMICDLVDRAPIGDYDTGPAIRFALQGTFHPLKYIAGLAREIVRLGGHIYCRTHASDFRDGTPARVRTATGHTITSRWIVVATNTPVNDRVTLHTKQAAYRTYVVAGRVPRGTVRDALYWDMLDPYHYVRLQPLASPPGLGEGGHPHEHDLLIVGGEDHKTGQADDFEERFARLAHWTAERFPTFEGVDYRWSGQVIEPVDSLAFIGLNPGGQSIYVATGDSGHGMTHATLAGMIISDQIAGRQSPWGELYDPGRRTLRTAGEWVRENVNALSYYSKWLAGSEVDSPEEIPPGEGAVVRQGLTKVACYKAPDGSLHTCSAMCTHLGGQVLWNRAEKSWDCPVHGSRFDPTGRVVNGPAITDLGRAPDPETAPGSAEAGGSSAARAEQTGAGRRAAPRGQDGDEEESAADRASEREPSRDPDHSTERGAGR
ncbi:MAG TPA: FAD-dependent oxidoreductase [Phycisphaerales bacterium]|nr:FAD-dependent oxidoreductase [Phycisphaerales bacterium]